MLGAGREHAIAGHRSCRWARNAFGEISEFCRDFPRAVPHDVGGDGQAEGQGPRVPRGNGRAAARASAVRQGLRCAIHGRDQRQTGPRCRPRRALADRSPIAVRVYRRVPRVHRGASRRPHEGLAEARWGGRKEGPGSTESFRGRRIELAVTPRGQVRGAADVQRTFRVPSGLPCGAPRTMSATCRGSPAAVGIPPDIHIRLGEAEGWGRQMAVMAIAPTVHRDVNLLPQGGCACVVR